MHVLEYNPKLHQHLIERWLKLRDMPIQLAQDMPQIGFIAIEKGTYVGGAFLRRVEGSYGQIDGFITNPMCSKELRNKAATLVNEAVIWAANKLELKAIVSYTEDYHTIKRAESLGFKVLPHTVISLLLRK